MSLLDTTAIADIFGAAMSDIYGDGLLIRVDMVTGPNHSQVPTEQTPVAVKVQVDRADDAMRGEPGYTAQDVKLIILAAGLAGRDPNTDDVVVAQSVRWKLGGVRQDPARSHWIARGIRQSSEDDEDVS